jgi:hypothetical protein
MIFPLALNRFELVLEVSPGVPLSTSNEMALTLRLSSSIICFSCPVGFVIVSQQNH